MKQGLIALPKHAVLLGANNTGKTAISEGLAMLFARERTSRPITDWDFHGGLPQPHSRFFIIATICDFATNDPVTSPDWFAGEGAALPMWWDDSKASLSSSIEPPNGTLLATRIALACRYDDESCDFETKRYFYHGEADPFTDGCDTIPGRLLKDLGVFLLSTNRDWDKLLSFSSSSFLKVLREYEALPGSAIDKLKNQLRDDVTKVEDVTPLVDLLKNASDELRKFMMIDGDSSIAYRPTALDTASVLQSLIAHVRRADGSYLPIARHGSGTISLQAFLLILAFAEFRKGMMQSFTLVAEEPEMHLHPALHHRLVQRIRSSSTQSIVTTHSPQIASGYLPSEVVYLKNIDGFLTGSSLGTEANEKAIRKLYSVQRDVMYEALMGGVVLVPEGAYDFHWLRIWQRIAQASVETRGTDSHRPISVVPTNDSAIAKTFIEVAKYRPDAVVLVDGDAEGDAYVASLVGLPLAPKAIIQLGKNAAIECLAAWIIEPSLSSPSSSLSVLLSDKAQRNRSALEDVLIRRKKEREEHEELAWEALAHVGCCERVLEFMSDVDRIASGEKPSNNGWNLEVMQRTKVYRATHIQRT